MNLDWTVAWQYRALLFDGVIVTVLLTVLTMAIAVPGGIAVMLLRQSRSRALRAAGTAYVEFFRNLPLILLVYWAFYVLPLLIDVQLSPFATGLIALSLNVSAYNSETFRAEFRQWPFQTGNQRRAFRSSNNHRAIAFNLF